MSAESTEITTPQFTCVQDVFRGKNLTCKADGYNAVRDAWNSMTPEERRTIFNVRPEAAAIANFDLEIPGWEQISIVEQALCAVYGDHRPPYESPEEIAAALAKSGIGIDMTSNSIWGKIRSIFSKG
jgi:hypothetical protein